MFDVGFWEIALIGVIALLILGPDRLPRVARTAGHWVGRARRFVTEVKADINAEIEAEDLKNLRNMGDELKSVKSDLAGAGKSLKETVEFENKELIDAINESAPGSPAEENPDVDVKITNAKAKKVTKKTKTKSRITAPAKKSKSTAKRTATTKKRKTTAKKKVATTRTSAEHVSTKG